MRSLCLDTVSTLSDARWSARARASDLLRNRMAAPRQEPDGRSAAAADIWMLLTQQGRQIAGVHDAWHTDAPGEASITRHCHGATRAAVASAGGGQMTGPAGTSAAGCTIGRRAILRYGGLTGAAAIGSTVLGSSTPAAAADGKRVLPAPKPIPGGLQIPGGPRLHVFPPGPPEITLPYSGVQLQGLDVEPSVMTDYSGFTALAFHVGTAAGSDGKRYLLETDMRAFRGGYVGKDGSRRSGSFAFVWVDLFEPGPGPQVHDYNGGVQPSGLFWVVQLHHGDFRIRRDGRRATLNVCDRAVLDSFQFGGPLSVPAMIAFSVTWDAIGRPQPRGKGSTVGPEDPAAFRGLLARARSTASFSGTQLGFGFRSHAADTDRGYAEMGTERNGAFLAQP
jgi:hypothetical protein